jgi:hypothetical protein
LFLARYYQPLQASAYFYRGLAPWEPEEMEYTEVLKKISPDFCAIFNQAKKADDQEWKLVAGPGYRKSLEFLIKDYLCGLFAAEVDDIKKKPLGDCIKNVNWVPNERLRTVASRAAWLGNDEVHYLRKWEDKDLNDLKALIGLTVHWIEMEETTKEVLKDMPEGK